MRVFAGEKLQNTGLISKCITSRREAAERMLSILHCHLGAGRKQVDTAGFLRCRRCYQWRQVISLREEGLISPEPQYKGRLFPRSVSFHRNPSNCPNSANISLPCLSNKGYENSEKWATTCWTPGVSWLYYNNRQQDWFELKTEGGIKQTDLFSSVSRILLHQL